VDERTAQFFVTVGRLCADACIADLSVQLHMASGDVLTGVPRPPPRADGHEEVDDTGYADELEIDGVQIALSDVVGATLNHPRPPSAERLGERHAD
jgi:hypothetical protein